MADSFSHNAVVSVSADAGIQLEVCAHQAKNLLCIALVMFLTDGKMLPEEKDLRGLVSSLGLMAPGPSLITLSVLF